MPFRKDKLHQRRSNSPLNEKQSSFEVVSAFKRFHFPLNSKCPQNTTLTLSPSPVQKSILCWGRCFTFKRCPPCKKLTKHACAGLSSASFVSCVSCSELGDAPYSWPLHCSLPCPNPHPLHKHRLPPRVLDSRTVSLPAGGTLVSSQSLMAAASIYLHPERR